METIKILVIGENQDLVQSIQTLSDNFMCEVVLHNDINQGLDMVEKQQGLCNIVLFDYEGVQKLTSEDLTRLKKTSLILPVVFVCSNEQLKSISTEFYQGLVALLIRPINNDLLRFSVDRLLSNQALVIENKVLMKLTRLQANQVSAERLVGKSMAISYIRELVDQFSQSKSHVLILGEKGTGKKLISKIIYSSTNNDNNEYLAFDCQLFDTAEVKNILFEEVVTSNGTKHSFKRSMLNSKKGVVILFDKIHAMNKELQNMLLQSMDACQDSANSDLLAQKIRIIATSSKDLKFADFDENLLFKLNMIEIRIPPLRERREDIPELMEYFNYKYSSIYLCPPKKFEHEIIEFLKNREWSQNVLELENLIRKLILQSKNSILSLKELNAAIAETRLNSDRFDLQLSNRNIMSLDEMINRYIVHVLSLNSGVKEKTARDLKIDRKTLYRRLKDIDS